MGKSNHRQSVFKILPYMAAVTSMCQHNTSIPT